jgi:predicted TIM-barrel fold metal-dependent hydrolase
MQSMSSASPPETRVAVAAIDCDVHCDVPAPSALYRYIEEQWADFMRWTGFKNPGGTSFNYPPWSPMLAQRSAGVERVQEDVLSSAERAILHCYYGVEGLGNPYLAAALATAVNRWVEAEWLDRDERLLGSIAVTPQHAPQAASEIERVGPDKRFVQVLLPARSPEPYGNQRFWPIFEAAAEHDLVLALTYGGVPPVRWTPSFFEDYALITSAFQTQITSLIMCGVFDRWPNLKVTVCESGWTWLPAHLWRMDQEWKSYDSEVPWLKEPPSSYVRRHFRFGTGPIDAPDDPSRLANTLAHIGGGAMPGHELLLYASDYPHVYDGGVDALLSLLDAEQRDRVMHDNAKEWYGL